MPEVKNIRRLRFSTLTREEYSNLLNRTEADLSQYLEKVQPIIAAVRERGDGAICEFTAKFDGATVLPQSLRVSKKEFLEAEAGLSQAVKTAILQARDNIVSYHRFQMPKPIAMTPVAAGVLAGERFNALESVACYVPRGKGSFPSVCLMTAAPAVVAGVKKIVIITPPGPDGTVDAGTLFASRSLGLSEVYKCGGAQAVAAVAYGTATIPKCVKIVGPGSPWVVAAKQILSRQIDPGPPAGPSEAIVVADRTANTWKAALDLMNESEHGLDSSAYLVTDDAGIADEVDRYIPFIWQKMSDYRRAFSQAVLTGNKGGILLCDTLDQVVRFVNDYAPEHLQ
ncbi:MAG TPA: histidinol dehydrogenase, partial [Hyphomicrobiales bacterium]|nr:histidinol dehydrogenase [Hyphomicrobiales bacterium]